MKGKLKKLLCLLCVLTLLFTSTSVAPALAMEEAQADAEVSTAPEAGGAGQEESGLFIMTGLEEPPSGPVEEASMNVVGGQDAEAAQDALSQSKAVQASAAEAAALQDGSSVVVDATPSVTLSTDGGKTWTTSASVSKKSGETESVWVTIAGYPSGAYLQASNSNSSAFSCTWGDWNGAKIPIRITGRKSGGGTITVNLKNTLNTTIASATIKVTIVDEKPTLTFSPSSLSMKVGESKTATLTVRNYSGGGYISASVANGSVCSVQWGNWNNWTIPLTVRGKAKGSTKVTVRLYNNSKTELASVTLDVTVTAATILTASPSSVSLNAGQSSIVTVTASQALTNGDSFKYTTSNSSVFTVTSSTKTSNSIRLVVTGKSGGSETLTVSLNNQPDTKVTIPVKVNASDPKLVLSPASVTVKEGASVKVQCTAQNVSGSIGMRCTNNASSKFSCGWKDSWSGNTVPLTITGKAAGSGAITIELLVGSTVRATGTILVTVTSDPKPDPDPTPDPTPTGGSPSYSFSNYSKRSISLALCQFMFGKTEKAKTVYNYDVGNGGVCFGMATTSGLLSGVNAPSTTVFGSNRTTMKSLQKSDYSTTLASMGMSLTDFIEAMHISQMARTQMVELSGVSNMVSAVRSGGTSKPVIICMRGPEGGHAILAYGVNSNGLKVYDSNYPLQERTVKINGENWSYDISSSIHWNRSNGKITYIPYDTYYSVWNNKGSLKGAVLQDGGLLQDDSGPTRYLLATTADDFSLTVFDKTRKDNNYEREVAVYEKGVLTKHDNDVEEVIISNVPVDAKEAVASSHLHMLYVPGEDLYTVYNRNMVDGQRSMDITLSGDGLSVHVNSQAETFVLAVSDKEKFATAQLNGLEQGEYYSISVGASLDDDEPVDDANIEGYGNGQTISLGIGEGLGMGMEGLYIAGGSGLSLSTLSLNEVENEASDAERPFTEDFALNSTRADTEYQLTAETGEGGKILPQGQPPKDYDFHRNVTTVLENGNYTYRVQPEPGYTLKAIYVNGVQAAYSDTESEQPTYSYHDDAYEYVFRDVRGNGYLYAEFAKNIEACEVSGNPDSGVVVKDGDKILLQGVDYEWSVSEMDGQSYLVVQALSGSDYDGASMTPYKPSDTNDPSAPEMNLKEYNQNEFVLRTRNAENPVVVAAAYERNGNQAGKLVKTFFPTFTPPENAGDEILIRISLQDAGLPESYILKAFLVSDTDSMRVLCDPVEVRSGEYGGSGGGGGGMVVTNYYLSVNASPADGAIWLSQVKPTADNIATMAKDQTLPLLRMNAPMFMFYAVLENPSGNFSVTSGSVSNVEEIGGRKVATITVNAPSYVTPSAAQNNPVTVTFTNA